MSEETKEPTSAAAPPAATGAPAAGGGDRPSGDRPSGDRPGGGPGGDRRGGGGDRPERPKGRFQRRSRGRRRVCRFCAEKSLPLDYKWFFVLDALVSERGRIVPSRTTGTCAKHQRRLKQAIKRARHVALLAYSRS